MELMQVRRWQADGKATIGQFFINGSQYCHCLEPALTNPVNEGHPRIPAGRYPVGLRNSPHFGPDTPEILKVPGRSDILIHAGNFPKDSLGCLIVGLKYTPGEWEVHESKEARDHIYAEIRRAVHEAEDVWIDVIDSFEPARVVA